MQEKKFNFLMDLMILVKCTELYSRYEVIDLFFCFNDVNLLNRTNLNKRRCQVFDFGIQPIFCKIG